LHGFLAAALPVSGEIVVSRAMPATAVESQIRYAVRFDTRQFYDACPIPSRRGVLCEQGKRHENHRTSGEIRSRQNLRLRERERKMFVG
jgi:hypothetical protein